MNKERIVCINDSSSWYASCSKNGRPKSGRARGCLEREGERCRGQATKHARGERSGLKETWEIKHINGGCFSGADTGIEIGIQEQFRGLSVARISRRRAQSDVNGSFIKLCRVACANAGTSQHSRSDLEGLVTVQSRSLQAFFTRFVRVSRRKPHKHSF